MSGSIPLAASPEAAAFEENAYRKAVWRIVPLLIVCFIFAYFDRVNISFAKLQMQGDLGLSNAAYGFGASIFFVGYFIFEIPSNLILSRVGARVWIARIMISWGIASAAMMFVTSEKWFYVLRFVIGATEAGFLPGIILYFTYWFPAKRRARINALFMTSISISGVIGGPLSGFIMTRFAGVGDWRAGSGCSCLKVCRPPCAACWCWPFSMTVLPARVGSALKRRLCCKPTWIARTTARHTNLSTQCASPARCC